MSDFDDDEPIDGPDSIADKRGKGAGSRSGRDDDWDDDEPVSARRRPARDDDWDDDDDWDGDDGPRGPRKDLTLYIAIAVGVAIIALVVILTRPKDDNKTVDAGAGPASGQTSTTKGAGFCADWPAVIGGDGKNVSKGEGLYVWSDFTGWHVRSSRTDEVVVKITSPGAFKVKDKGNATASSTSGKEITLTVPPGDGATGPDLEVGCESSAMTINVSAAGNDVPAADIKLGGSGKAEANPVTLTRGT